MSCILQFILIPNSITHIFMPLAVYNMRVANDICITYACVFNVFSRSFPSAYIKFALLHIEFNLF